MEERLGVAISVIHDERAQPLIRATLSQCSRLAHLSQEIRCLFGFFLKVLEADG